MPRWGGAGLRLDRSNATTWAKVLRDAGGYTTALAGKWQLHHLRRAPRALDAMGFDEHCVWPGNEADDPELTDATKWWGPLVQTNGARARHGNWTFGPDVFAEFALDFVARAEVCAPGPAPSLSRG